MEDKHLPILLKIEPKAIELTKEDYEKRMGIGPERAESKKAKDVREPVDPDPEKQAGTSVPVSHTRPEAIKILTGRGIPYSEIKSKTKQQLLEML